MLKKLYRIISSKYPIFGLKIKYFYLLKRKLHLKKPIDLNEKILYLLNKTDTSRWTDLADKYRVRNYIKEKIGDKYLVNLYGKWENPEEIDFKNLPKKYILKTNHGCGTNIICLNNSNFDKHHAIKTLKKYCNLIYGKDSNEYHYTKIKPLVIAEELLINDEYSAKFSSSLIDYKFWCFNGKCHYILVCSNRQEHTTELMIYDRSWHAYPEYIKTNKHYKTGIILPKPEKLEEMIEVSEKLSDSFPILRVDLYSINKKIYFGELTFSSCGGMMTYFTKDFLLKAGNKVKLN